MELIPDGDARSLNDFFYRMAADAPRGRYPRWLYREQTYWTPVDIPDGGVPALLNEDGMVEVQRAGYGIEPMLTVNGEPLTWADCMVEQSLVRPPLPVPESTWISAGLALTTTVCADGPPEQPWLFMRYRLENHRSASVRAGLHVAVRPFQVSPPWQGHKDIGGARHVRILGYRQGAVRVNGRLALVPLSPPAAFGAAAFDEGSIADYIAADRLPEAQEVLDMFGFASGALRFDLVVPPGGSESVWVAAPLGEREDARVEEVSGESPEARLAAALATWEARLGAVEMRLPELAQEYVECAKGALAHILINRDGPALQPGPRRYTRSWIRDGAVMAAALLRFGCSREAGDFIRWYAQFQSSDGNVPCCVDRSGVDWLPEHDSHGQLIFAIADYYRLTKDRTLAEALWPAARKAVGYLEQLRADRLTERFREPSHLVFRGLLPESVSHEGYLSHPVHSYWDDFWALRGFKDAAELSIVLGDTAREAHYGVLRDDFRAALHVSITRVMEEREIDYLPGSVEWADPDPTATANALTLIDEGHRLPGAALSRSFDLFVERFRDMHGPDPVPWNNYTAYEIRIAGALVRLGRRDEAHEILSFYLDERRPAVWNQWPEITWSDPRSPGHQGDLPHAWIGAEYCLVMRDLFAYEREMDESLVVAAGIPADWVDAGEVAVRGLPTIYGRLDFAMKRTPGGSFWVSLGGDLELPPGGIRIAPPVTGPLLSVEVNGAQSRDFNATEARITALPAEVCLVG